MFFFFFESEITSFLFAVVCVTAAALVQPWREQTDMCCLPDHFQKGVKYAVPSATLALQSLNNTLH